MILICKYTALFKNAIVITIAFLNNNIISVVYLTDTHKIHKIIIA